MTDQALIPHDPSAIVALGQAANRAAAIYSIEDYRERKGKNTLRSQDADLLLFAEFISSTGVVGNLDFTDPTAWQGITWGLVKGFVQWLLTQDYSMGSVNRALSTVKVYARLAFQAGAIDEREHSLIRTVQGYSGKEAKRVNERREKTRKVRTEGKAAGKVVKKEEAILISKEQARILKTHPDTPQGRRDTVLMHLLLDHGLRAGEVAILKVGNFNLSEKTMTFYRPKVDKTQTLELTTGTWKALKAWFNSGDVPLAADAPLLRGSRKGGYLSDPGMSERAITERARVLAEAIGINGYSAHDTRHYWATHFYKKCKDPLKLQESGGWNSLAMPRRYVEWAAVANEGVGDLD